MVITCHQSLFLKDNDWWQVIMRAVYASAKIECWDWIQNGKEPEKNTGTMNGRNSSILKVRSFVKKINIEILLFIYL